MNGLAHDGISDVNNLRRLNPGTVVSEHLQNVEVKYKFQHAHPLTCYLGPQDS